MCMIDDAEPWTFYHDSIHKARVQHTCIECDRTISPGERYERFVGNMDGRWSTFKTCAHCMACRSWLHEVCGGWMYQGVLDELEQHWDEEPDYRTIWLGRAILTLRRRHKKTDGTMFPILKDFKLPESHA